MWSPYADILHTLQSSFSRYAICCWIKYEFVEQTRVNRDQLIKLLQNKMLISRNQSALWKKWKVEIQLQSCVIMKWSVCLTMLSIHPPVTIASHHGHTEQHQELSKSQARPIAHSQSQTLLGNQLLIWRFHHPIQPEKIIIL